MWASSTIATTSSTTTTITTTTKPTGSSNLLLHWKESKSLGVANVRSLGVLNSDL